MRGLVVVIVVFGCVNSNSIVCDDGRTCPTSTVCESIHHLCVAPDALTVCSGVADDTPCTSSDHTGICNAGVCIEVACGDGIRLGLEQCDGNDFGASTPTCRQLGYYDDGPVGCTSRCTYDTSACARICGDRVVDPEEKCDSAPDQVIADCTDLGYYDHGDVHCSGTCHPDVSACTGFCGDGVVNGGEACEPGLSLPIQTCIDAGYDAGHVGCTSFCTPDFSACKRIGWQRLLPEGGGIFFGMWPVSSTQFDLATDQGFVTVANRQTQSTGPSGQLESLWGTADNDVWVAGNYGYVGHWDGTTLTQSAAPIDASHELMALWGTSDTNIYAAGIDRIAHYDGTWTDVQTVPGTNFTGLWGAGNEVFAVGNSDNIWHYTGSAWQTQSSGVTSSPGLLGVGGSSASDVYAVGQLGLITHYNGSTWTQLPASQNPATNGLYGVYARSANDVLIFGGQTIHYDGSTWWDLDLGAAATAFIHTVRELGGRLYASGSTGGLFEGTGAWWTLSVPYSSQTSQFVAAATDSAARTYVVSGGELLQKTDAGFSTVVQTSVGIPSSNSGFAGIWQQGSAIALIEKDGNVQRYDGTWHWETIAGSFQSIAGVSATELYAGGYNAIYRFNGTSWSVDDAFLGSAAGMWAAGNGEVFAIANGTTPTIRHRSGGTWMAQAVPAAATSSRAIWGSSPTDVFAVGLGGVIIHYDGTSWTQMPSPTTNLLTSVSGSGPSDVWAVSYLGDILRYDGVAWNEVRSPLAGHTLVAVSVRPDLVLIAEQGAVHGLVRIGTW